MFIVSEGPTDDIKYLCSREKTKTKMSWFCIIIVAIAICLLTGKTLYKLKENNENVIFPPHVYLGGISK